MQKTDTIILTESNSTPLKLTKEVTDMGIHKHGKLSAKAKSNEQYKAAGRYAANKQRKADRHQKRLDRFAERRESRA